nr:MAG TPA: hypothetical protein [Caudoviricetes sp.]
MIILLPHIMVAQKLLLLIMVLMAIMLAVYQRAR